MNAICFKNILLFLSVGDTIQLTKLRINFNFPNIITWLSSPIKIISDKKKQVPLKQQNYEVWELHPLQKKLQREGIEWEVKRQSQNKGAAEPAIFTKALAFSAELSHSPSLRLNPFPDMDE